MANIKLGLIITDIQGSVGGSTFRRTPRGVILYNKQGTQIKSAFAPASRKNQLGNVFSAWQNLSAEEQTYWNEQATLYPQKNKFGSEVYLTGRQFFTKLSAQMLPAQDPIQISPLDDRLSTSILQNIACIPADEKLIIAFDTAIDDFFLFVSVYPLRKGARVKPHAHFKRTYAKVVYGTAEINIWDAFKEQYPLAVVGEKFGANIQMCSYSGFLTSVQALEFEVKG
jgi:hypothetical protein